jgi:GntR family transcriptional repressor for pyruvate dehydrogenase complex
MARFGVGRPAIREALLSLEQMGIIEVRGGQVARVVLPTPSGIIERLSGVAEVFLRTEAGVRQLQDARTFLEAGMARFAAKAATDDEIGRLRDALVANENALGNLEQFEMTDVKFHEVISKIVGNPIFTSMHDAMIGWLREQRRVTLRNSGQPEIALLAHRRIFDAIASRDPERAEQAMSDHMNQLVTLYWRMKKNAEEALREDLQQ